jgi:DNA-binding response OmpR family regulator
MNRPPRVLLAEDDAEMRQLVTDALEMDGVAVSHVPDGRRLLAALTHHVLSGNEAYDLIVADIRMPVYSGLDVIEAFRESNTMTPIILMTAFGDEATRARAESMGALLFDKPFEIDDLRTAVVNLLHRDGSPPSGGHPPSQP